MKEVLYAEKIDQFFHCFLYVRWGSSANTQSKGDVVLYCHMGKEGIILGNIAYPSFLWFQAVYPLTSEINLSLLGMVDARNALHEDGLACSSWTQNDEIFSLLHLEGNIYQLELSQSNG
jgi:hypothetical protein